MLGKNDKAITKEEGAVSAMAETITLIQAEVEERGITRLCHFTPSRNLSHIAADKKGILASCHLRESEKAVFNPTDIDRLDGYPDHVCCSIQYPNAWYFKVARKREQLFLDWVVLFIRPDYLWWEGTRFCPRNAAAEYGGLVREGFVAFKGLFAESVGKSSRGSRHPDFLPTDEQAEVLIPDRIQRQDILAVAVRDEAQARRENSRLELLGRSLPSVVIAEEFYSPYKLSGLLRSGKMPRECLYRLESGNVQ